MAATSGGIDPTYLRELGTGVIGTVNNVLVPAIFTIALLVFLWGVAKAYVLNANSDAERAKGHKLVLWAVIGFAVMLSVWGLVNLLMTVLGITASTTVPRPPTI